ncbi:MAG: hypothetical protein KKD18_02465 [Nanoarchaeota archaeon]|nr:hypothetical protein [Nanoarchaeota archaeon]MBU0977254.1 hypothetical protein [Nanoarchaeota archaeon]
MRQIKNKKAQGVFGMSFSMIFSIFIIIFIISVAFFAIRHFVGLWRCSSVGLYYEDLREEVRDAWSATSGWYQDEWTGELPSGMFGTGITHVCFGDLSATTDPGSWASIKDELIKKYRYNPNGGENVFMYPPDKACASDLGAITLKCNGADCMTTEISVNTPSGVVMQPKFFCVEVKKDGKVSVWLVKKSTDYKVTVRDTAP